MSTAAGAAGATGPARKLRGLTAAALLVVTIALALRLTGVDTGLPFIYDPDEPDFVGRAFRMWETGDLNPHWFGHPGSTTMYSFWLVFSMYAALSGNDVVSVFQSEPGVFYLMARCLIVIFAVGSVVLTGLLARRVTGSAWSALFAAALLAVAPLSIQYSRIARPDTQVTFLVLAGLWFCAGIYEHGRWRDYLAAGFLLGLAVATKYPALVFTLVLLLAHVLRLADKGGASLPRLAGAAGATVGGALVGAPYLFLSLPSALADIAREARSYHLSGTSEGFLSSLGFYLSGPAATELGIAGAALGLIGAASLLSGRDRCGQMMLAAALIYVLFISTLSLRWDRWLLPAIPLLCVVAAYGLERVRAWIGGFVRAAAVPVAALIAAIATGSVASISVPWTVAAAKADTRDLAWQWIMDNVPPGSSILTEAYTPQLSADRYRVYAVADGVIWRLASKGRRFAVPEGVIGSLADPAAIARSGVEYIAIANHYDRRLAEASRYEREINVYRTIMNDSELVFEARPRPFEAVGLPIRIYRLHR